MNALRELIINSSDELALALNCYFEARAEWKAHGDVSYAAVTAVVMNRACHPTGFNSTPKECIAAHRQFSWTNNDSRIKDPQWDRAYQMARNPDEDYGDAWEAAKMCATAAMTGKMINPVANATFYFNPNVCDPKWSHRLTLIADIGAHRFMAEPRDPDVLWEAERSNEWYAS